MISSASLYRHTILESFVLAEIFVASGFGGSVRQPASHTLHMPLQLGGVMLTPVLSISCSLCLLSSSVMGSSHRTSLPINNCVTKWTNNCFYRSLTTTPMFCTNCCLLGRTLNTLFALGPTIE